MEQYGDGVRVEMTQSSFGLIGEFSGLTILEIFEYYFRYRLITSVDLRCGRISS